MSRYDVKDKYTYPGTSILINKADIRDQDELIAFERRHVLKRMLTPSPPGSFDLDHLNALHHHLFQDVYSWAGELRDMPLGKPGVQFANPVHLHSLLTKLFQQAHMQGILQTRQKDAFAATAAYFMNELNVLHPYREGNGRVMRLYLFELAENAGFGFDADILRQEWLDACIHGYHEDESGLNVLFMTALSSLDDM